MEDICNVDTTVPLYGDADASTVPLCGDAANLVSRKRSGDAGALSDESCEEYVVLRKPANQYHKDHRRQLENSAKAFLLRHVLGAISSSGQRKDIRRWLHQ